MLQQLSKYFLFLPLLFSSCEKENSIEDVISKQWTCEWKRCGVYHNSRDIQLFFNYSDTTNSGWVKESDLDTCYFDIAIPNQETIVLSNSTCSSWDGVLKVSRFHRTALEFERSDKSCDNELFLFK